MSGIFPKIFVFITKTGLFRVSIKFSKDTFQKEITIGGERWSTKELSGEIKDKIRNKCGRMLTIIVRNYMEICGITGACEIYDNKGSFRIYNSEE